MSKNHEKQADKKQAEKEDLEKDLQPKDESAVKDEQGAGCGCEAPKETTQEDKPEKNDDVLSPEKRIEELEAKCRDWQDQYLRKAADFENYRKRMIREKQEAIDYANSNLLLDLVQVLDDFDRAIDAGKTQGGEASNNAFVEGVVMIKNQMVSMLSYIIPNFPKKQNNMTKIKLTELLTSTDISPEFREFFQVEIAAGRFDSLLDFFNSSTSSHQEIYPAPARIFRVFQLPLEKLR